jgi:hypothetical protein
MALPKSRATRSTGLSDIELAEALGISLKRLVGALNEAGLCRCPEKAARQSAKPKAAASAAKGISHSPGALNPPFVFGCVLSPCCKPVRLRRGL